MRANLSRRSLGHEHTNKREVVLLVTLTNLYDFTKSSKHHLCCQLLFRLVGGRYSCTAIYATPRSQYPLPLPPPPAPPHYPALPPRASSTSRFAAAARRASAQRAPDTHHSHPDTYPPACPWL